jgi:hypothetical protein
MILSNVNIGTGPSAGDGDPLRTAFNIVNNNFQIVTNNVNALTNSVNSVAGRTGNVILTTQDIIGINYYATNSAVSSANVAMKGYVDSKITANIALLVNAAPSTLDTIRELADAIGDDPNFAVNIALSVSNANTAMKAYVDGQILAANSGVSSYSNVNTLAYLTTNSYATQSYVNLANTSLKNYVDGQISAANTSANTSQLWNNGYTLSVSSSTGNVTLPRGATLGANGTTAEFKPTAGGVLQLRSDNNFNRVQVNDTDVSIYGGDSHWHFDYNGKLTLPSGANITAYFDGITTIRDGDGVEIELNASNGFSTRVDTGTRVLANAHAWTFGLDGNLTLPAGGQILDSTGNIYTGGSSYGNTQVATYLPTYTGNIQAGNIFANTAYRFTSGLVSINNLDNNVELNPDTNASALAGVKIGGNGYILSQNGARSITLNYNGVGGAVGLQSNVTVGAAGSGNLVVNGSLTIRGNIINGNVAGFSIGYRDVPQISAGNVTLGLTDAGKHYYATASAPTTLTIPSNANVAFPVGTAITVVNAGTGTITVDKQVEASLYLAGNSTNATRTLSSYGMATLLKTASDQWFINGTGLA